MPSAAVVGLGAVGARAARQLAATAAIGRTYVTDPDTDVVETVVASLGPGASSFAPEAVPPVASVLVLASPAGTHVRAARAAIASGQSVVSVSDDPIDVEGLLALEGAARTAGVYVVAGAGFMPGLSCALVRHAAEMFDTVEEIHVAKAGSGGPACARQYHQSLADEARRWDGEWLTDRGGSGRELMWFPDPVASQDCYRGALPDPALLRTAFPDALRIDARMAANRRDRLTMRLPMLRPPHRPEGGIGAIRVEVWGRRGAARDVVVYGAVDRPAIAAGAVAAVTAVWVMEATHAPTDRAAGDTHAPARRRVAPPGAHSVATLVTHSDEFLAELARRGVRAAVFEGERARLTRDLEHKF